VKIRAAKFISRVFDPVFVIPAGIILLFVKPELSAGITPHVFFVFFLIDVVAPLTFFLYSLRVGKISDWDTTKRTERYRLYIFTVACWFAGLVLISTYGNQYLFSVLLILTLLAFVFAVLTFFTKISVHVGTTTVFVLVVNLFFGFRFLPLFLFIPAVGWSRIVLGFHTYWQVWMGVLIPLILLPAGFEILGLL
jgi:hypothetical protein